MGVAELGQWVREFAAGVHAGNAVRHGLPVPEAALREGHVRDAAAGGELTGTEGPASATGPAPASPGRQRDHAPPRRNVAAVVPRQRGRVSTVRGRA
jgi:hypothetical protein